MPAVRSLCWCLFHTCLTGNARDLLLQKEESSVKNVPDNQVAFILSAMSPFPCDSCPWSSMYGREALPLHRPRLLHYQPIHTSDLRWEGSLVRGLGGIPKMEKQGYRPLITSRHLAGAGCQSLLTGLKLSHFTGMLWWLNIVLSRRVPA